MTSWTTHQYHRRQQEEDEALARALQMQFEREAVAGGVVPSAPPATMNFSARRSTATSRGIEASQISSARPPAVAIAAVTQDEEIARQIQEQEEYNYRKKQQQQQKRKKSQRAAAAATAGTVSPGTIAALPPRPSSARKSKEGIPNSSPNSHRRIKAPLTDEEFARRFAIEQESAAQAAAVSVAARRSRKAAYASSSRSPPKESYIFAAREDGSDHSDNSPGYLVPGSPECMMDEPDDHLESPLPPHRLQELSDQEFARRVEQELQDELVAERLQQREQERLNQRRINQLQSQQQQQRAAVQPAQQQRRKICGSLFTIAVVVGAVIGIVYYFVILGGGVPSINLTPEDFANEDPFDEMTPEEANAWDNNGNGVKLTVINALETKWYQYFYDAIDDWDNGYPDTLTLGTDFHQAPGSGSHDPACSAVSGRVKVCNGDYGNTRWKGINEVLIDGSGAIVASSARMNEFYLGDNDDDQMQYTMCHELGHAWGLPHTDETFGNPDLGDCMDYTNNPEINRQPKERNFIFLWRMYGTVPGAAPYVPPTSAPSPQTVSAAAPTTIVAQNSTIEVVTGGGVRSLQLSEEDADDDAFRLRSRPTPSVDTLEDLESPSQEEVVEEILVPDEPLPAWLSDSIHAVLDRRPGRRLQPSSWRILHSHTHGEIHEADLPRGFSLRVHYLNAITTTEEEEKSSINNKNKNAWEEYPLP